MRHRLRRARRRWHPFNSPLLTPKTLRSSDGPSAMTKPHSAQMDRSRGKPRMKPCRAARATCTLGTIDLSRSGTGLAVSGIRTTDTAPRQNSPPRTPKAQTSAWCVTPSRAPVTRAPVASPARGEMLVSKLPSAFRAGGAASIIAADSAPLTTPMDSPWTMRAASNPPMPLAVRKRAMDATWMISAATITGLRPR